MLTNDIRLPLDEKCQYFLCRMRGDEQTRLSVTPDLQNGIIQSGCGQCNTLLDMMLGSYGDDCIEKDTEKVKNISLEKWEMTDLPYIWKHTGFLNINGIDWLTGCHCDGADGNLCFATLTFNYQNHVIIEVTNGSEVDLRVIPKTPWLNLKQYLQNKVV